MAISPTQVKQFDPRTVDQYEEEIDKKLKCIVVMPGGSFDMVLSGSLNPAEKAEIIKRYESVGWKDVAIKNSEEGGERPGLFRVSFKSP